MKKSKLNSVTGPWQGSCCLVAPTQNVDHITFLIWSDLVWKCMCLIYIYIFFYKTAPKPRGPDSVSDPSILHLMINPPIKCVSQLRKGVLNVRTELCNRVYLLVIPTERSVLKEIVFIEEKLNRRKLWIGWWTIVKIFQPGLEATTKRGRT